MSAAACKPSRSASAIIAVTSSGYHLLKIDGYSRTKGIPSGDKIKSRAFSLGGHRWHIDYHPNGFNSEHAEYISIFLVLDDTVTTAVKAQHEFCFVDEVQDQAPSLASSEVNNFTSKKGWGVSKLIKRADFEKSEHLKDDSFAVRCDIVVINDYRPEDLPENTPPTFVSVAPSSQHQHLGDLLKTEKGADVVFEVGYDIEAQVFKALLCFTYTDSLPEATNEEEDVMCQHLLVAADRYNMDRLKTICEDKLCKYINVGTVATILTLAEQHHCDGLETACFHFLRTPVNLTAMVDNDGFDHLSKSCPSVIKKLVFLFL
ncbi:hypothetical protein BRADI_3g27085v3 [Brachypodium distachyon]|uniref:MATH domain-containing protein n=1 Tax=Brachypodium distachyon TaxID=15368 RepID=A0A0Q3LWS0_BRADI|nr:hypothetical protein BRADI_3g27085v3 [Brachypodium distachyon]